MTLTDIVQEINERTIRMEEVQKNTQSDLSVVFRTLEGNGQPGLKQKVATLETSHRECQERQASAPSRMSNRIAVIAIGVMVLVEIGIKLIL